MTSELDRRVVRLEANTTRTCAVKMILLVGVPPGGDGQPWPIDCINCEGVSYERRTDESEADFRRRVQIACLVGRPAGYIALAAAYPRGVAH